MSEWKMQPIIIQLESELIFYIFKYIIGIVWQVITWTLWILSVVKQQINLKEINVINEITLY